MLYKDIDYKICALNEILIKDIQKSKDELVKIITEQKQLNKELCKVLKGLIHEVKKLKNNKLN